MKKILTLIIAFVVSMVGVSAPVMAMSPVGVFGDEERGVRANILTDCANETQSEQAGAGERGILCVLRLAVTILSIGVGILGVIGISVSGIQYLTAGGSEEKTRKAKRRIFEIVLGLAAYAVIYALLMWLSPSFS